MKKNRLLITIFMCICLCMCVGCGNKKESSKNNDVSTKNTKTETKEKSTEKTTENENNDNNKVEATEKAKKVERTKFESKNGYTLTYDNSFFDITEKNGYDSAVLKEEKGSMPIILNIAKQTDTLENVIAKFKKKAGNSNIEESDVKIGAKGYAAKKLEYLKSVDGERNTIIDYIFKIENNVYVIEEKVTDINPDAFTEIDEILASLTFN